MAMTSIINGQKMPLSLLSLFSFFCPSPSSFINAFLWVFFFFGLQSIHSFNPLLVSPWIYMCVSTCIIFVRFHMCLVLMERLGLLMIHSLRSGQSVTVESGGDERHNVGAVPHIRKAYKHTRSFLHVCFSLLH